MSNIRKVILTGEETRVLTGGSNACVKNNGAGIIYASASPGITADASEGVLPIAAGESAVLPDCGGTVYLLGSGEAVLIGSDYVHNFFKPAGGSSGGSGGVSKSYVDTQDAETLAQSKEYTDSVICNPNLLINPDFKINQRGQKKYTSNYGVDRWRLHQISVEVLESGLKVKYTDPNSGAYLIQEIDNPERFNGKTITLSVNCPEVVTDAANACQIGTAYMLIGESTWKWSFTTFDGAGIYTNTHVLPNNISRLRAVIYCPDGRKGATSDDYIIVSKAKLEIGDKATPFVPPDPATELLKCQRYYQRYERGGDVRANCTIGNAFAFTGSLIYSIIPKNPLREGVTPSVAYSGVQLVNATSETNIDFSNINLYEFTDNTVQLEFASNGQTQGTMYRVRLVGIESYMALDAEIY